MYQKDINKFVSDTFGFNDFDISNCSYINTDAKLTLQYEYGGFTYATDIKSIEYLDASRTKVILDFYAEGANTTIARTVEYVLNGTLYKNCVIESRTVLFDSGDNLVIALI